MYSTQVRSNGAQLVEAGRLLDNGSVRIVIDTGRRIGCPRTSLTGRIQDKVVLIA
ncbi:hypothetical protein [Pseudomonas syringae]|uniref:Uncharacterized protein n=1 Tax=Pseudomonas syringae pv. actinidifoliorum ICMP 18803 TaxID=1194400 RepID=A0AAT9SPI2_PSESX|nr:hypothetical protein [Pseudomonas syringae]MDU8432995.1 hypothetical protein [Pseudomonas syringae pv. actinidifoliorum]MDU8524424.1 hypothetical protein [Pseudomonas syringae pv. actinidifoliorum]MDU8529946.1 hypothetical protein [Pseudomonas syringae pv. actinidifoliorum]UYS83640.1 hypothetical protein A237_013765 [Pseudomonas syringae pv. actinidifoliorum ICMP 18803]